MTGLLPTSISDGNSNITDFSFIRNNFSPTSYDTSANGITEPTRNSIVGNAIVVRGQLGGLT